MVTFVKFGVIITSTIGISFLTAMLFFGALLHYVGPQEGWGDIFFCNCCEDKEIREKDEQLRKKYDIDGEKE